MAKSNSEFKSIQKKLVAAVAMVLVASIMVVSSSYAWFTLSTAPEVTGIQTAVGSNGNLEMALRHNAGNVDNIPTSGGSINSVVESNKYWGNLVDLSDTSYGLSGITLAPARLNFGTASVTETDVTVAVKLADAKNYDAEKNTYNGFKVKSYTAPTADADGSVTYTVTNTTYKLHDSTLPYLKTAEYGTDGRVSQLNANTITGLYDPAKGVFLENTTNYFGIRTIGKVSGLTPAELALRNAKQVVNNTISSVTTAAQNSMNLDGSDLANILIAQHISNGNLTNTEYDQIVDALDNLDKIAVSLKNALDQTVLAIAVAQDKMATAVTYDATNGIKTNGSAQLDWTGLEMEHASLLAAYADLSTMTNNLSEARKGLPERNTNGTGGVGDYLFTAFEKSLGYLMTSDHIMISVGSSQEYTVGQFKTAVYNHINDILQRKDIVIHIRGGIYAQIAEFVGNYTGNATVAVDASKVNDELANLGTINITAILQTEVSKPTVTYTGGTYIEFYLPGASDWVGSLTLTNAGGTTAVKPISDHYGYIVDLAFRTNAKDSNLMLQTDAISRVFGNEAEGVQGSGSYMEFTVGSADYTVMQMIELMNAVRVVFCDDAGNIFGIAGLDVATEIVMDTESGNPVVAGDDDVLKDSDGKKLKFKNAGTTLSADGLTIKASLNLYEFVVDNGVLTLTDKIAANDSGATKLTELVQNKAKAVSALVYLDGDMVDNGDVAINGSSMTGTMNLQFSSSANLVPMNYTFQEETATKLNKPASASLAADGTLTIANVENATGYQLYYVADGVETKVGDPLAKNGTDSTTHNLNAVLKAYTQAGTHTFKVTAVAGDGYSESDGVTFTYNVS